MTMNLRAGVVFATALLFAGTFAAAQTTQPVSLVDPLIGTDPNPIVKIGYSFDTGNVYPGAVCPRGIVAWSPDTTHCNQIAGGYWYPDSKIEDFSMTHFSGRGVPCLKNVGFMPVNQAVSTSPGTHRKDYATGFSHQNESASAGYYRVKLDNGIETELTATLRTGMARFTFPAGSPASLLIRANGSITVDGSTVSGYEDSNIGKSRPYRTYFYARFSSVPTGVSTWADDKIESTATAKGATCGAILSFDPSKNPVVEVRVGLSYTSQENAEDNLKQENSGADFAGVKNAAAALWNTELSRIEIEGGTTDERKVFYTALYHCLIHPNLLDDVNGQYIGMDQKVHTVPAGHHQYQNIPAWDEHRSHTPLMAVIAAKECGDVMQSLVNYAEQDAAIHTNGGGLPRWEQVNRNTGGMVGDGDDTMLATAYAFGATGFDAKAALKIMEKGADEPGITNDGATVRGGLKDYLSKGYIPDEAAVTLEYCNDDFAASQLATRLGDQKLATEYLVRAQNWKHLYDSSTGYIRPKNGKGDWAENFLSGNEKGYVEGSAAQYTWLVNFNYRSLIDHLGGNDKAVERLDHFFTKTNDGLKSDFAYMGNEPCEETPWVYDFAGAPSKTQEVVRRIQTELFTTEPSGLPGNDDAGSLSSWYVFSALGIYPEIPGVGGFVVGSPVFPKAIIHLENGKTITIVGMNARHDHPYVQSMQVNGKDYLSPWIPWPALSGGGTIQFELSNKSSKWGDDPKQAPPSFDVP